MEYLCNLTKTPTGGIVLDPLCGSGSTGIGCIKTERPFVLIDIGSEYTEIAKHRIKYWQERHKFENLQTKLF